jgi:UDP-N-acetylmuramoyl-L-alanine---L-glutamate ligase
MRIADLAERRVAVWGYGREGRAAISALRRRLPTHPITVFCSEAECGDLDPASETSRFAPVSAITKPPDAGALGAFDVVIKSPGISAYRPELLEAQHNGTSFTSGTALWFAEHPEARVIAVTGTKGKSTVSALLAHFLRALGRRTALAGNIGLPLLDLLDPPETPDWWVVELSSFQTRAAPHVEIGVINNLYEEHLDWHLSRSNYVADKLAIAARAQYVVVNAEQSDLEKLGVAAVRSEFNIENGWHVHADAIWHDGEHVLPLVSIPLPGVHNAQNVCAALAAIDAAGEDARSLVVHIATFKPLPHRLQTLGAHEGIDYVNDSISTTPYAAIEALRSLEKREVTILVGGFDRGVSWQPFAEFVAAHPPRAVITMGANRAAIEAALRRIEPRAFAFESAPTLAEAFVRARAQTRAGGVVLLSPGAPSFDQFHDYAERGRAFARLAGFDPSAIAQIEGLGIA